MRREYLDSMKADGFGEFLTACETLRNCKFIVAEGKISDLLKAIADNRQLYAMFGAALVGFDYKSTFNRCVGDKIFLLPTEPKTAIALVFRIFIDMDSGKMPLRSFLEAYFYDDSVNESFARFALEVISPFESYCRMFISQSETEDSDISRSYEDLGEKYRTDLKRDAVSCVAALIDHADNAISAIIDRQEFNACLKGLTRSIKVEDDDAIISAFVGVKYAVAYFFKSDQQATELYKKLEYDVKRLVE